MMENWRFPSGAILDKEMGLEPRYLEHPAMFGNHPLGFIGAILLIPVGVGILILLAWRVKCKSTRLELTENNLILETGLLSKERTELNIERIRTVRVTQTFSNRIFGVGKISIFTSGDAPEMVVAGMPRPYELNELIKASDVGSDDG